MQRITMTSQSQLKIKILCLHCYHRPDDSRAEWLHFALGFIFYHRPDDSRAEWLYFAFGFFYSGAVRGLLIVRSQQAIYRIVRNRCGYKTTLSDFRYVISGLNGEPKSASFFSLFRSANLNLWSVSKKQTDPNSGYHCPKIRINVWRHFRRLFSAEKCDFLQFSAPNV